MGRLDYYKTDIAYVDWEWFYEEDLYATKEDIIKDLP